jgi:hypothetical protein
VDCAIEASKHIFVLYRFGRGWSSDWLCA